LKIFGILPVHLLLLVMHLLTQLMVLGKLMVLLKTLPLPDLLLSIGLEIMTLFGIPQIQELLLLVFIGINKLSQ
jgi:hypothetical protein